MMTGVAPSPIRRGSWNPAIPAEVAEIFSGCKARWWIAWGYAIELAAGQPIRGHVDIDVLMLRRDQLAVQQALPGWQWQAADPPGTLRPWQPGEQLAIGVHDIWCSPSLSLSGLATRSALCTARHIRGGPVCLHYTVPHLAMSEHDGGRGVSPRCPRTAINSQRSPPATRAESEGTRALNSRATQGDTLVMRRSACPSRARRRRQ